MSNYTVGQQMLLTLTYKISSVVGIFCSTFLITELVRDHTKGEGNPVKRALMGVCFFEILDAFGYFLSGWATPREYGWVWAVGTQGSCSFQGFLLQAAIGGPLNTGLLTYFFYMLAKRQTRSAKTITRNEWKYHVTIDIYSIGAALLLLILNQYNYIDSGICWIIGSPYGCNQSIINGNPDIPCDRGDYAYIFMLTFNYIPLWSTILFIIYLNYAMRKFLLQEHAEEDAQWITTQALLYSAAFFITWTPSTLVSVISWFEIPWFWLVVLSAICEPLQGFWNLLIFMRSRPDSVETLQRLFTCKLQCCVDDTVAEESNIATPRENRSLQSPSSDDKVDETADETTSSELTSSPNRLQPVQPPQQELS